MKVRKSILLIEMAIRYRGVASLLPFNGWLRNPTTMVLPLKGCARVRDLLQTHEPVMATVARIVLAAACAKFSLAGHRESGG